MTCIKKYIVALGLLTLPVLVLSQDELSPLNAIENHFSKLISSGLDEYGQKRTPVWMASIDPTTGRYPKNDQRPDHIPQRVYLNRSISAPKGANIYWDFPAIAAAYQLSEVNGNQRFKNAAQNYVRYILDNCTSKEGMVLWGNHYYYDAFQDAPVKFKSSEKPVTIDFNTETGNLHESRPMSPPWELLWAIDEASTKKHLEQMLLRHMVDMNTGEFNRHADGKSEYAFIEYGSILAYTCAFLYSKTGNEKLLEQADRIISFNNSFRHQSTGLMENSPTKDRWDKYTSTTEVGLWSLYILKAAKLAPEKWKNKWQAIAADVLSAWLEKGWDEKDSMYLGGLKIANGSPYQPQSDYPYQPGMYADIWEPLFPTHNYPMQMAEACLKLYASTDEQVFKQASERWLIHVKKQIDQLEPDQLLYAENFARILHFLVAYGAVFQSKDTAALIDNTLKKAMDILYLKEHNMFRSHSGEYRYDAVDGVGLLALVILQLETGKESEYSQYFF